MTWHEIIANFIIFRKSNERQVSGLDSDDDSEREEYSKPIGKGQPRRSLAIQSGHKVLF